MSQAPQPLRLLLGGFLQDPSGAGLIHAELGKGLRSAHLASKVAVEAMPLHRDVPPVWRRLGAKLQPNDAVVWTSAPLPARIPDGIAVFPLIYDLRWLKTRSLVGRTYRALDLARTLRRARAVFTISEVVAAQLSALTDKAVVVLPMGPGQFADSATVSPVNTKTIVLIGRARHKRNEEAARLIAATRAVAENYRVVAVDVSPESAAILRAGLAPDALTIRGRVERSELAQILAEGSVFLSLGVDEGFGFPYIESRYFGCDVIAPDVPITREVLGRDAPGLLAEVDGRALVAALEAWDLVRVRREQRQAHERSWGDTSRVLLDGIERHL